MLHENQLAGCAGKIAYETRDRAQRVLAQLRKRKKAVSVYRCQHCFCWHIGGMKGKR